MDKKEFADFAAGKLVEIGTLKSEVDKATDPMLKLETSFSVALTLIELLSAAVNHTASRLEELEENVNSVELDIEELFKITSELNFDMRALKRG